MNRVITFAAAIFCTSIFCIADSNTCPVKCDFWVLAGQSNMQGYGKLPAQTGTDSRIIMLNMDNHWMPAQDPLHRLYAAVAPVHRNLMGYTLEQFEKLKTQSVNQSESGVGPGCFFAKHLVENGVSYVGLIPCAHGGTSMDQWSPTLKDEGDNSLYGAMINRIKLAGGKIKGVLWYQGENDSDERLSETYESKMLNFIDCLRRDVNDPEMPFLYVQIARLRIKGLPESRWRAVEKIREAQRRLMSLRPYTYMVTACDLPLDDAVHISYDGQQRLGRRLAEMALTYVYKKAGHANAIDVESIEAFNDAKPLPYIKVRFKGVSGKLFSDGRPADFDFLSVPQIDGADIPYRTDFDPSDPSVVLLRLKGPITSNTKLIYGLGLNPYMNIVDEKDMAVPAFGPYAVTLN